MPSPSSSPYSHRVQSPLYQDPVVLQPRIPRPRPLPGLLRPSHKLGLASCLPCCAVCPIPRKVPSHLIFPVVITVRSRYSHVNALPPLQIKHFNFLETYPVYLNAQYCPRSTAVSLQLYGSVIWIISSWFRIGYLRLAFFAITKLRASCSSPHRACRLHSKINCLTPSMWKACDWILISLVERLI